MFYRPGQEHHGLPRNPFNALVVPRPIGWISSLAPDGTANLAPYSFFNAVSYGPPQVMFSAGQRPHRKGEAYAPKDSQTNPEATGEFVCNMATWDLRAAMNLSSEHVAPGERRDRRAVAPVARQKAAGLARRGIGDAGAFDDERFNATQAQKVRDRRPDNPAATDQDFHAVGSP